MPLNYHLSIGEHDLVAAIEVLSAKINDHFEKFKLIAEAT